MKTVDKKINKLLILASEVASSAGVEVSTLSNRLFGYGGFFKRLEDGKGCTQKSYDVAYKYLKREKKNYENSRGNSSV